MRSESKRERERESETKASFFSSHCSCVRACACACAYVLMHLYFWLRVCLFVFFSLKNKTGNDPLLGQCCVNLSNEFPGDTSSQSPAERRRRPAGEREREQPDDPLRKDGLSFPLRRVTFLFFFACFFSKWSHTARALH